MLFGQGKAMVKSILCHNIRTTQVLLTLLCPIDATISISCPQYLNLLGSKSCDKRSPGKAKNAFK